MTIKELQDLYKKENNVPEHFDTHFADDHTIKYIQWLEEKFMCDVCIHKAISDKYFKEKETK